MQTNIFPVRIDFNEYQISRTPYSVGRLAQLRADYNHTHSFFRDGDFIYISNKDEDDAPELGEIVTVSTYGDAKITSSLIKHLFFRTFKDRFPNRIPTSFYPFRIFSQQDRDDLIQNLLPQDLQKVIAYRKQIEIQLRLLQDADTPYFGFTVTVGRNWSLNKSCLELADEGFDVVNKEVLRSETLPGLHQVLAPNEEFIGVLTSIEGNSSIVQTSDGEQILPLGELTLKKSKKNIQEYLAHALSGQRSEQILVEVKKRNVQHLSLEYKQSEINTIGKLLARDKGDSVPYMNRDGFYFTIGSTPYSQQKSFNLQTPTFVFDHGGNKIHPSSPDQGLNNFGPYDSLNFDIKAPNILAICAKANRGRFSAFLSSLFEGVPNSQRFKNGFKKKYELHTINYEIREINEYSFAEYSRVIASIRDPKPHLAIIEEPEEFKNLPDRENPYYLLKAKLFQLEIPVQFVTVKNVVQPNQYTLNNLALQLYTKLGGTPWVSTSARSVDRELVIGIGHSMIRSGTYRGAEQSRVVGISTFFSADGQYLLSNNAKDVPYDEYFEELLGNLTEAFDKLEQEQGWQSSDTIRLIFHIFKPIKNVEFEVVSELIRRYARFSIQFAFVTISKQHPFLLIDPAQSGLISRPSGAVKGKFVPDRGQNVKLDETSCIVQMFGPNQMKTSLHGASSPLLVRIRTPQGDYDPSIENLLFTDLNYIVQQIYTFSYLSWRSFFPQDSPATMLYANLIAGLLGKLRNIDGWDPDVLNFGLKRRKWFL